MGLALIAIFTMTTEIRAAAVGEDFYRGKVIRIVVGFSAVGGLIRMRARCHAQWESTSLVIRR
jgi:hypothetical protein